MSSSGNVNFSQIQEKAGNTSDPGGISGYLDRVKNLAGNDYPAYLEWSQQQQQQQFTTMGTSSQVSPSVMLEALQSIDFEDSATIYANNDSLTNFEKMPLATGPSATYFLIADNTALQARPRDSDAEVTTENTHPFYLRLYTASDSPTRSTWLPKFALPLGRVLKQTLGSPDLEETNYVLVVDCTEKNGAIWLIYNRFPVNQDVGVRLADPVDPKTQPEVFDVPNADSIRIMDSVNVWANRGSVAMKAAEITSLAKAFGGQEAVLVTGAKMDDFMAVDTPNPAFGG